MQSNRASSPISAQLPRKDAERLSDGVVSIARSRSSYNIGPVHPLSSRYYLPPAVEGHIHFPSADPCAKWCAWKMHISDLVGQTSRFGE